MTPLIFKEDRSHLSKTNCYICQSEIGDDNDINPCKFRNHYHYKGNYRKVAQSICSLK